MSPPISDREAERLALLAELRTSDSATADLLDGFAELASIVAQCPIAWLSFVAPEHELVATIYGARARVIDREGSLGQAIVDRGVPIAVQNPTQPMPLLSEAKLAYFAGFPLVARNGHVLGAICVVDTVARTLSLAHQAGLAGVARLAVQTLVLNSGLLTARAELATQDSEREQLAQAVGKLHDVTIAKDVRAAELVEQNAELQNMAETDALTGLRNYRSLTDHIRKAFATDTPIAVILIDVDWFKNFNDAFGHVAGDETLGAVGALIATEATHGIIAARYGGEEFALVVPSADTKAVLQLGEQLRRRIERHPWPRRPITVSAGVATRTADVDTVEDLIRRADDALYAAKRTGKNRVLAWVAR
ncbi:MAG: GGDEF domain-containing protein [Fimbriimonadaceae bacterium]